MRSPLSLLPGRNAVVALCVTVMSTALFGATPAAPETPERPGALAEFILNLARYASWPATPPRRNITICFAHGGALSPASLQADPAATVRGLPVVWKPITSAAQLSGCAVVWLNADVRPAPRDWIVGVAEQPVLSISNYADFTADGGVVGAYRVGEDWRFEINLEALSRSRLNIAAAALRLSQRPKPATAAAEPR